MTLSLNFKTLHAPVILCCAHMHACSLSCVTLFTALQSIMVSDVAHLMQY